MSVQKSKNASNKWGLCILRHGNKFISRFKQPLYPHNPMLSWG